MKRKIVSIALSVAVLGGGLATAMPANAATNKPTTPISRVDSDIAKKKEELRIAKIRVIGNKTLGNSYDKQARNFFTKAVDAEKKSEQKYCEYRALLDLSNIVKTSKDYKKSSYTTISRNIDKDIRTTRDNSGMQRGYSNSYYKQSSTVERLGNTFSHQRAVIQKFNAKYEKNYKCVETMYKYAKSYSDTKFKSMNTADKKKISELLNKTKTKSEREKYYYTITNGERLTKNKIGYTISHNKTIKSLEEKISNLEKTKKAMLKK